MVHTAEDKNCLLVNFFPHNSASFPPAIGRDCLSSTSPVNKIVIAGEQSILLTGLHPKNLQFLQARQLKSRHFAQFQACRDGCQ